MSRPFKPKGTHKISKNWTIDPQLAKQVELNATELHIGESTYVNRLLAKHLTELHQQQIGAPDEL